MTKKSNCGVYRITNTENGKRYYGSSSNLKSRIGQHKHHIRKDMHANPGIREDAKIYGDEVWRFEVLCYCAPEDRKRIEGVIIDRNLGSNCYNRQNGSGSYPLSAEHKRKLFASFVGIPQSETHRRRISEAMRGKTKTEEHKRKIGEGNTKAMLAINPKGEEVHYSSRGEAAEELGIALKTLRSYINNGVSRRSRYHGWAFVSVSDFTQLQHTVHRIK